MSVSRNLTSLEILGIAIRSEIEAGRLYEKMEKAVGNVSLKEKFRVLKEEEQKHQTMFETMYRKAHPDVELRLPEKSMVPMMDVALKADMTIKELFEVAMKAEQISEEFYAGLAKQSHDPTGAATLTYLSNIERGHYLLLQNEYQMIVEFPAYAETDDFLSGERFMHVGP